MKKEWTLGRHEPMLVELEIAKAMQDKSCRRQCGRCKSWTRGKWRLWPAGRR